MEEMQKIAEAYYNAAPDTSKKVADDFISEVDENGDGNNITLSKFLNFTRMKNYSYISNPHFFNQLNLNLTGILDRREALTLFYIINSGRPICIGCGKLVTTIFFTCVKCFDSGGDHNDETPTFDLCCSCFCAGSYYHGHNSFVDNFVLLQMKRRAEKKMKREKRRVEEKRSKEVNQNVKKVGQKVSSCQAIVPATGHHANQNLWQAATLGVVVAGAKIAQSLCTIM